MAVITSRTRFTDSYRNDLIAAGAIAGFLGGACMALLTMILSASAGMGFWHPVELMSGIFYGADAILGGAGPVITGLIVHAVLTTGLGALFGAILPYQQAEASRATGLGLIYSVLCWAAVTFLVLPLINQTMKDRVDLAPGWWFASFLLFGIVLGATPAIRSAIGREVERATYEETRRVA
jgi:hypothetical protein